MRRPRPRASIDRLSRAVAGVALLACVVGGVSLPGVAGAQRPDDARRDTAAVASAAAAGDTAWAELYRRDLERAREVVEADHPGAVDRLNPAFARTLSSAYAEALAAAGAVTDYSSYRLALARFGNRFQDAHLSVGARQPRPLVHTRDAGVYPVYRDESGGTTHGAFVVASADAARYGALADSLRGATLLDCDGRTAADVFRDGVLAWRGRPSVEADAYTWAPYLLVDVGPPTAPGPSTCRARTPAGRTLTVPLRWASLTDSAHAASRAALAAAMRASSGYADHPLGVHARGAEHELWVDLPTFAVNDDSSAARMRATIDSLRAALARDSAWRLLVFDLRGNSGGSSVWGDQIAAAVFGADWANRARAWLDDGVYTEWRVSKDNVEAVRGQVKQIETRHGADSPQAAQVRAFADSMAAALARGDTLYAPGRAARQGVPRPRPAPVPGRIVVVTTASCFSACLDFLDVMRLHPAVVQVGQPTGVDTDYMENWGWPLPSGLSQIGYPMKVYRNRRRANNTGYVPRVRRDELADGEALADWIRGNYRRW